MLQPDHQQELLDEVVEDFTARLRSGQRPAISEYSDKHPELSEDIEEVLTSVAMIEELKRQTGSISGSLKREMKEILQLDRIGDYQIVRELGRGGMGIVFEAVHESLGRRVAIKVMPNRTFDDEKYLERFRREAQAAANLHHTNIVSVFGFGQTGEHHYYVMEFVDGESLSNILTRLNGLTFSQTQDGKSTETIPAQDGEKLPQEKPVKGANVTNFPETLFDNYKQRIRWAAEVGSQVADGLAYAHALGTLHRDIKPSNLLVDKNKTIWLTDFGLVKNLGNQSITKTGDIVGTPQYMAPESFEGTYDQRSETYCLGLTLYEIATLQPAYENASTPELIRLITTTRPSAPRKIDPRIPRDLDRIIRKAISREPEYRYQSTTDMRDDLRAFLDDRPISARKISMTENIWRWSIRNPMSAGLAAVTGLMIMAIAFGATYLLRVNQTALHEAQLQADSAWHQSRLSQYANEKSEEATNFTVKAFDEMFRGLVFNETNQSKDISLDGFNNLEGVSNTITESDAKFLEQMLQFYQDFAKNNQDNLSLKLSVANSRRRVANIYHLTGQYKEAVKAYEESIEIYKQIHLSSPNSIRVVLDMTKAFHECGRAWELQGFQAPFRREAARKYQAAAELLQEKRTFSLDDRIRLELAKTHILAGSPIVLYRAPLPERFQRVREWEPRSKAWFATPNSNQVDYRLTLRNKNPAASMKSLRQANRIALELSKEQALQLSSIEKELQSAMSNTSDAQYKDEVQSKDVVEMLQAQLDELVHAFAETEYVRAMALTRLATSQFLSRDFHSGNKSLASAEGILQKLQKEHPANSDYRFVLAQIYSLPNRNSPTARVNSLKKSKELLVALAAKYDTNLNYKRALADCCFRLGLAYKRRDEPRLTEWNLKIANSTFRELIPLTPRNQHIQTQSLACLLQLTDFQMKNGDYELAVTNVENALNELKQSVPRRKQTAHDLLLRKVSCLRYALALMHHDAGNTQLAHETAYKALDESMAIQAPRNQRNNSTVAKRRAKANRAKAIKEALAE